MEIKYNGKVYNNLQGQVAQNTEDIEKIKNAGVIGYEAGDGIDITSGVISVDTDVIQEKIEANPTAASTETLNKLEIDDVVYALGGSGPNYSTELFTDVWGSQEDFLADYNDSPLKAIESDKAAEVYWLMYARHGNDPIANLDLFQWKQRFFSVIYVYGPSWVREMSIQETWRGLTDDQIRADALQIYNHAYNPETAPGATSEQILTYINEQNTNRSQKVIVDAYMQLDLLLKRDVTNAFLKHFDKLFKQFVYPECTPIYTSEEYEL